MDGRRRVLVIEDGPEISEVVRTVLEEAGYDVRARKRGRSGLKAAETFKPDVVVLDLFLPDLPGVEVLRELRAHPETAQTPVVVLSAVASTLTAVERAMVQAVVRKPFDVDTLLRAVQHAQG